MEHINRPAGAEKAAVYRPPVGQNRDDNRDRTTEKRDYGRDRGFGGREQREPYRKEGGFGGGGFGGGRRDRDQPSDDTNDKWAQAFNRNKPRNNNDAPDNQREREGPTLRTNQRAAGFYDAMNTGEPRSADRVQERQDRPDRGAGDRGDRGDRGRFERGDRGDGEGPRRYGGARRVNDEEITDARFVGKFGGGNRDRDDRRNGERDDRGRFPGRAGYSRQQQEQRMLEPLPTAPKNSWSAANASAASAEDNGFLGKFKIVDKKKKDKANKSREDECTAAESRPEEEETQNNEEAHEPTLSASDLSKRNTAATRTVAVDGLKQGLKGKALLEFVKSQISVSGEEGVKSSVAGVVLAVGDSVEDLIASKWWKQEEAGETIKSLIKDVPDEVALLFALQRIISDRNFPSVEVKGASKKVIDVLFNVLLSSELVSAEGFLAWSDDDSFLSDETPGRVQAIIQSTSFISGIRELLMGGDDEEEDEDLDLHQDFIENKA